MAENVSIPRARVSGLNTRAPYTAPSPRARRRLYMESLRAYRYTPGIVHLALLPGSKMIRRASLWQYFGGTAPIGTLCLVLLRNIRERHGFTYEVSLRPCAYAGRDAPMCKYLVISSCLLDTRVPADKCCVKSITRPKESKC